MIILNLLPPEQKMEAKQTNIYVFIESFLAFMLLISVIIAVVLLFSRLALEKRFYSLATGTTFHTIQNKELDQKIKLANKKIRAVSAIQNDFIKWSAVLINFNSLVPKNVEINSLIFNEQSEEKIYKTEITGIAKDRETVLAFQKRLESSLVFTNIEAPLSNLLKRQDVEFKFTAEFKP